MGDLGASSSSATSPVVQTRWGSDGVSANFNDEIFKPRYQRNNKRGGLKNLRCFPSCGFRHKERGFCGRSVLVNVNVNQLQSTHATRRLRCWVEFVKKGRSRFNIGDAVTPSQLEDLERNKDKPTQPWVRGEKLEEKSTMELNVFEFNKERRGWHYGWASNKHTCNSEHCLQCYVLEETTAGDKFVLRAICQSPSFMLFCRRRRRFAMVPSAPVASPNKRMRGRLNDETEPDAKIRKVAESSRISRTARGGKVRAKGEVDVLRMDAIMRKLGSTMVKIQQHKKTAASVIKQEDDFQEAMSEALDIFATMPDVSDDNASWNTYEDSTLNLNPIEPTTVKTENGFHSSSVEGDEVDVNEQMLEDVARYLLDDGGFRRSVEELASQSQKGIRSYPQFLQGAKEHLEAYRRSRNISIAEFERMFATAQSTAGLKDKDEYNPLSPGSHELHPFSENGAQSSRSYLSSAFDAIASLVSSSSAEQAQPAVREQLFFYASGSIRVPNISGQWRRTPESEVLMQEMRTKCGTPWVLSKMFEFMESRFEIEQEGLTLYCRFKRKFISNTTLSFLLDGEQHEWGIRLPAPFSQLSQGWTYRAWVDDNKVVITHAIGNQRLIRVNWVNETRSVLYSTVILEIKDEASGVFNEAARCNQQAIAERYVSQL